MRLERNRASVEGLCRCSSGNNDASTLGSPRGNELQHFVNDTLLLSNLELWVHRQGENF